MIRKLIIGVAVALAETCAVAAWVTDESVESAASAWLSTDRVAQLTMKGLSFDRLVHRGSLRIVHLSPSGYIVMSGSDIADPVISFSGNDFVEPEEGSPFQVMLEHSGSDVGRHEDVGGGRTAKWAELIGNRDGSKPSTRRLMAAGEVKDPSTILIEPFMEMHWNQWQPWNDFCPVIDPDVDDQLYRARCACGCVATATAQQIAYCRWPWRAGRSDSWNHTLNRDGEGDAEDWFLVRFDGHAPFGWESLLDVYSWWWGDVRGKVPESERFPIARFVSWVDVITKMNFGKNGSGANFGNTGDSTTDWYEKWEECNLETPNDYGVAKIKADLEFGVPVHIGVPGHSVIAHGFASDGESYFLYLNYGWGGSADGWYKLYDSAIGGAFPGFRPKKMVQLEPLPNVSEGNIEIKWHLPPCHSNTVRRFEILVKEFGSDVGSEICDFSHTVGMASNQRGIYVTNGAEHVENDVDFVENDTDFLWWNSYESGTYDLPGERILTGRSILSYRLSSSDVGDRNVEIQATFGDGEWETVSKPLLNRWNWSKSWITQRVFLGQYAGKMARFRIKVSWAGGRLCFDDFKITDVIQPSVVSRSSVSSNLRSCSLSGFGAGKLVGVSLTPIFDDENGLVSECQFTRIAGESHLPRPEMISIYVTNDVIYTSGDAGGVWEIRGVADGDATIRAHNAWYGGFDVALPGLLTEQSMLSFGWYEIGCYALDTEYDTIVATFVDECGVETNFWNMTNQNQQTERQLVEIPLGRFAGKSGGLKIVFRHNGVNYVGDGDIMRFFSPMVSNIAMPILPKLQFDDSTFSTLPQPQIISIVGHDGLEIDEGLYRECEIGEDLLLVRCSQTVERLAAYPSHLSLMSDDDISVEAEGNGVFTVSMNTSKVTRRSRMILTLAATDSNGTTIYRDVSLRFDTASAVKLIDGWRAMDSFGFKPVNAFTFDKDMSNSANGPLQIGGGDVSYVESPLGFALYHNGNDGPWTKPNLNLPDEWTVLTIARVSDVNNAVLFQFGSSEYDQSGFALASGGRDRVTLSHWMPHKQHVDLLSVSVSHVSSQYHAYAIRVKGKSVELFVDGIFVGNAVLPTIPTVGFQLFSLIQGNGDTGLTNANGECMEDWRMYDAALPESMIARYTNLLSEFDDDFTPGWRINVVTFDPNGGVESETVRTVVGGLTVGALPNPTREGYAFNGWFTMLSGGTQVTAMTVVTGDVTYFAHWTKNDDPAPPDPVTPEPTQNVWTVTFDAQGGTMAHETEVVVTNGSAIGTLPTPIRDGHSFVGWFTATSGGTQVTAATVVTGNVTYYAQWVKNDDPVTPDPITPDPVLPDPVTPDPITPDPVLPDPVTPDPVTPDPEPVMPCYEVMNASDITEAFVAPKAVTLKGAVYDGCDVIGIVELKLGKVNEKKKTGKVSGTLADIYGKKHKIASKKVANIDDRAPQTVSLEVKDYGTMTVTIGGTQFAGSLGRYHIQSANVGNDCGKGTVTVKVSIGDLSKFTGTVIEELLPADGVKGPGGGRWSFEKAASVKWAKVKGGMALRYPQYADSGKGLVVGDSSNPSGMKLTYTAKNGTFKGSFKVYALEGEETKTKLKKYTIKVNGVVVDGVGYGTATCKKPPITWSVTVE